jgi:hypothetical protein
MRVRVCVLVRAFCRAATFILQETIAHFMQTKTETYILKSAMKHPYTTSDTHCIIQHMELHQQRTTLRKAEDKSQKYRQKCQKTHKCLHAYISVGLYTLQEEALELGNSKWKLMAESS